MTTPSTSSPTSKVDLTSSTVYNALSSGLKWGGKVGTGATVTYSFPWVDGATAVFSGPNGTSYSSSDEPNATEHYALNATQRDAVRSAMQSWSSVANITAVEVADTATSVGDVRIGWSSFSHTDADGDVAWGWGYYPNNTYANGGDIWINTASSAATDPSWASGSYNYMSLIHELGHALGLKHPFEGTNVLSDTYDNRLYSVMAYDSAPHSLFLDVADNGGTHSWASYNVVPETPMVYDIAAIQYMYGANMTYHTGDDVYTFDPTTPFFKTIWDAGGNDTISVANFTNGSTIDLRDGAYSSIKIPSDSAAGYNWNKEPPTPTYDGTNNLGIAFGAVIENAIGGSGNDVLLGNSANNHLQGNRGINVLDGGDGVDTAVYTGNFMDYSLSPSDGYFTVVEKALSYSAADAVSNMERLVFKDVTVALSISGLAEDALTAQYIALAQKFYVAYFGRPADPGGLANMVAQLSGAGAPTTADGIVAAYQTNAGIKQLVDSFGNSEESVALYKGSNNHDFVVSIFVHLLGRIPPEGPGLDFWVSALDNGNLARGLAALNIVGGAEANQTVQGKIDAALIANRVTVAENFTSALNLPSLAAKYSGAEAASAARAMLDVVNQDTVVYSYESSVLGTIAKLPVQLVGLQAIGHDGLFA